MKYFVSVSGGLDSTALAIICSREDKWRYIFADTGDEFPQVIEHLDKMESILDIKIIRVKNDKYTLGEYEILRKYFPSYGERFCTRLFKIEPIEDYLEQYMPYELAIGIRADEFRKGNIKGYAVYPLQKWGMGKCDVVTLCQSKGLVPQYSWYMSRGGCYSCFFKSKNEILGLAKYEPKLFSNLIEREEFVQDKREKYYSMFDKFETWGGKIIPLRRVKKIVDSCEQIEMIDEPKIYQQEDCGVFCRK